MKTQIIIKADRVVKTQAQKTAKELGLPLSTVINAYLREFIRSQKVTFSMEPELKPEVGRLLKKASADFRKGKNVSPSFDNAQDTLDYLHSA